MMGHSICGGKNYVSCASIYLLLYFNEVTEVIFEAIYNGISNGVFFSDSLSFYS